MIARLDLAPNAVLVRPDGAVAFAALRGGDRVAVIDLETLEVVSEIPTGEDFGPGGPPMLFGTRPLFGDRISFAEVRGR